MLAGIYARISLDETGLALGVARQTEDCQAKAKALGWTVADTYTDNDVSASKNVPRPEYERLLADLEAGTINAVVVYDLDRLTRKPAELETFIDLADRKQVSLANVSGDVDLTNATGRMVARIKGAVARQEAERIGERVKRQKQQRAASGEPHKGRQRLYGYDESWQPVPAEAAIIAEAFMRRASGESTTAICKDFTERGIKTVAGNPWKSGTLSVTLKKSVYAGLVTFKGEVVSDSKYPALVDRAVWDAAQSNLANDSAGTNTRRYLLSGILICSHCLTQMKGNPSNHMYRCSATYGGCGRLSVRIKIADQWALYMTMNKAISTPPKDKAAVRDYDAEITALETERQNIIDLQATGAITMQDAVPRLKERQSKIASLRKEQARAVPKMTRATQTYMDYHKMNLSQKRAFINDYVDYIKVGPSISRGNQPFNPGRFEFHYSDGTVEVPEGNLDLEDI